MSPRVASLASVLAPQQRVALADGMGLATGAVADLCRASEDLGRSLRLLLGWTPEVLTDLHTDAFADVRTIMAGYGLRRLVDAGQVHYVPARLGLVPKLVRGPLRPDVVVATVSAGPDGFRFTTEVSWMAAAVAAGATIAAIVNDQVPCCATGPALPADQIVVVGESDRAPAVLPDVPPPDLVHQMAAHVVAFIPAGARLQIGPGVVGRAVAEAIRVPVIFDSGVITDAAVTLERRGLLVGQPVATYVGGTPELYEWARGKRFLHGIEHTHDQARIVSGPPFIAVNTALELDEFGQVNVEAVGGSAIAGIGGHPDFAFGAAAGPSSVSIVAVPTRRGSNSTLVERLEGPTSTPSHDVDVVVTEFGAVDLRPLDRPERRAALRGLWGL